MWVGELISEFLMGKEEKKVERREQREGKQKERVVGRTPDGPGGPGPGPDCWELPLYTSSSP